jgi:hypothetical protein
VEQLWTPTPVAIYGNGISLWHNGGLRGVFTLLAIIPDQEIVVAILDNMGNNLFL